MKLKILGIVMLCLFFFPAIWFAVRDILERPIPFHAWLVGGGIAAGVLAYFGFAVWCITRRGRQ